MKLELNFVKADVPLANDGKTHSVMHAYSRDGGICIAPDMLYCVYDHVFGRNRFNTLSTSIGIEDGSDFNIEYYALVDGVFEVPFKRCDLLDGGK